MKQQKYFELDTKRVALLGALLALNIICEVISQYVLALGPIAGFLSFSIVLWTVVVCYLSINELWAFVFLIITEFFRMAFGQNLMSTVSLILNDGTFLLVTMLFVFIFKMIFSKTIRHKKWFMPTALLIAMAIGIFITSGMDVLYNYEFMLEWLGYKKQEITTWLLVTILWFNIANLVINTFLTLVVFKPVRILVKRMKTSNTLQ